MGYAGPSEADHARGPPVVAIVGVGHKVVVVAPEVMAFDCGRVVFHSLHSLLALYLINPLSRGFISQLLFLNLIKKIAFIKKKST